MVTKILTIGHSTRSLAEFLALLQEHQVKLLANIRRFPRLAPAPPFRT